MFLAQRRKGVKAQRELLKTRQRFARLRLCAGDLRSVPLPYMLGRPFSFRRKFLHPPPATGNS